jgi:hypothetical protein
LDHRIDAIDTLRDLAPNGVMLPTRSESMATGLTLTEVALDNWLSLLEDAVKGLQSI